MNLRCRNKSLYVFEIFEQCIPLTEWGIDVSSAGLSKLEVNVVIGDDLEADFAESALPDFG